MRSKKKSFFAILADESSDVTKKEQLSFSVRTCSEEYEVSESFVGIYECSAGLSSDALLGYIQDILIRTSLDGKKMAAMGFDGAAAMKSLSQKLKAKVAPNAIYVHCFAHCNVLIVKDATKNSKLLSSSLDLCQSLYTIIGAYPKRILLFEKIQNDFSYEQETDDYKVLRLQNLSATRWTTRVKAADIVFAKFSELHKTLEDMRKDPSIPKDTAVKIKGILNRQFSSLDVLFNLNATRVILSLLEKLSRELQAIDISADYALYSIRHVLKRLQELRSVNEFNRILDEASAIPSVRDPHTGSEPRPSKVPKWFNDNNVMLTDSLPGRSDETEVARMRRSFYGATDAVIVSLTDRFDQEEFSLVKSIEEILLNSMKERSISIANLRNDLLNKDLLRTQLNDLPTILGLYNADRKKKITYVTRISTIAEIFNSIPSTKIQCSEVHKMIQLYYTVPLSSASCERTFSAMRRLKTWLRASTGANHLNHIMFANIHVPVRN